MNQCRDVGSPPPSVASRKRMVRSSLPELSPAEDEAVSELLLPRTLSEPLDYSELHTAAEKATRYCTAAFHAAIGVRYAVPSPERAARMSGVVVRLYASFDRYWVRHRGEMSREDDLAEDDAGTDRVSSWVACFLASTVALVAGACMFERLGDFARKRKTDGTATFDSSRNGTPYCLLTALSFPSIATQRVAQTSKPISAYDEWDIVEALDALAHAWRRLSVDDDVDAYVTALRLRFGMLVLSASEPPSASHRDPLVAAGIGLGRVGRDVGMRDVVRSKDGDAGCSVPSARCVGEMAARFLAYSEMRSMARRNDIAWSPVAEARIGRCGAEPAPEFVTRIGAVVDIRSATIAVARTLRTYAAETERYGTVSTAYRRGLQEAYVGPGDPGVVSARFQNVESSTKNVLRMLRGSRVFTHVHERSLEKPADVLTRAVDTIATMDRHSISVSSAVEAAAAAAAASGRRIHRHDMRAAVEADEEFAALCCMDALFRSRFGIDWAQWFLVRRATYREARKTRGVGGNEALPVVVLAWNTYDVLYRGTVLRTSSIFESLAWWLAILRVDHGSRVVAANFSGSLSVLSPGEADSGGVGRDVPVGDAGGSLNLEALPVSASVVVTLASLCDVVINGPRSFVSKVGDLDVRQFSDVDAEGDANPTVSMVFL